MDIEQVYREVAPKLQGYLTGNGCSYATACDIVQETFLRLWKRMAAADGDYSQIERDCISALVCNLSVP